MNYKIVIDKPHKNKLIMPKFSVGDTVCMKDDFAFNPCYKVLSIGKIESIHMYAGKGWGARHMKDNKFHTKNHFGRITYKISGFSLMPDEDVLELFTEKHLKIMESWIKEADDEKAQR